MPHSERHPATTLYDMYIVREPKSGRGRYDVDMYDPEHDADEVKCFACWKMPRGWQIFCFTFRVDMRLNPASQLGDFYAPKRIPDVQGSLSREKGTFRTIAISKTRGPYAASSRDIRRIYGAILAD